MNIKYIGIMAMAALIWGCENTPGKSSDKVSEKACASDACCKEKHTDTVKVMACKLGTEEFRTRRATVLAGLRNQLLEKKELANGYAFRFKTSDSIISQLAEFVKTERACCSFFDFSIRVSGERNETWLDLTGSEGVKDFINTELEFY